jgi:hypothetical protein
VPDEFGETVRRLEQLVVAAKKMRRKGLTIAPELKAEAEAKLESWSGSGVTRRSSGSL